MPLTMGLLGLVLLGADGASGSGMPAIQYHVRVLEMDGLGWRESLYSRLHPVARQGSVMVWTAGRETAKTLAGRARRVMMSPRVAAAPEAVAYVSQFSSRKVASQLTRHADGPVDHAVAVAYTPDLEDLREGYQFALSGRKLDQGVLTKVVLDETRVSAVHQVTLSEVVAAKDGKAAEGKISPQLDVPEIVRATAHGEWLIPTDEVLLVSLGAHTVDDGHGKAVVRERLMVIDANPASPALDAVTDKLATRPFTFTLPVRADATNVPMPVPADATNVPMPVPAMPSRSLPQGRSSDGSPIPLPPLPDEPAPPSSLPGSSDPCATPQSRPRREVKALDPDSTKASLPEAVVDPSKADPAKDAAWVPVKPLTFRVPLNGGVTIEIRASVTQPSRP